MIVVLSKSCILDLLCLVQLGCDSPLFASLVPNLYFLVNTVKLTYSMKQACYVLFLFNSLVYPTETLSIGNLAMPCSVWLLRT